MLLLINGGRHSGCSPASTRRCLSTRRRSRSRTSRHGAGRPTERPRDDGHARAPAARSPTSATCSRRGRRQGRAGDDGRGHRVPEVAGTAPHRRSRRSHAHGTCLRPAADRHQAGPRRASRRGADRPPARARDRGQPGRPHDPRLDRQALDPDDDRVVPHLREVRALVVDAVPRVAAVGLRVHRGHRDAPVPRRTVYAASHGCVRVAQYDAKWLFDFDSVGEPVDVIAKST